MVQLLREYFSHAVPPSDVCRCPVAFLHLIVPSADVDVNLEPNKSQVLLHNKVFILYVMSNCCSIVGKQCKLIYVS